MVAARPAIVLLFDSDGFCRLESSPRLAGLSQESAPRFHRLVSRYDSQAFELASSGVGLALCKDASAAAGMQVVSSESVPFGRWMLPLEGDEPDLRLLEVQNSLAGLRRLDMAPFAVETLTVVCKQAGNGASRLSISLESGRIETVEGERQAQVFRAVLSASPQRWRALVQLARLLIEMAPADLVLNEQEAALILAQGNAGRARRARRMGLRGIETVGGAFRLIARLGIEQIAANRSCIAGGDTVEGVHQMRVGVRRLRSAINLFRPLLKEAPAARISAQLKTLASLLGPVRDVDVFQEIILDPVLALLPNHAGIEALKTSFAKDRDDLLSKALPALDQRAFASLMLDLQDWSETGAASEEGDLRPFASKALDKRHRKLMKAGRDFLMLDPPARHALRIRGKKMRYAAEFLNTLFPETKTQRYLEALTHLVDVLGHLNDIAVARRVLEDRRAKARDAALHHGVGFVEGWHAGRAALLEEQVVKAWDDFKRQDKFWR
ncbi:MAG: CHAD domain-containing protein [Alphaproteobacteria bacterium]|nr:CHAD domain-containing protein [Alphaproteobacteria bacterium]